MEGEDRIFLKPLKYSAPLVEWKLSQIAQFRKIDEAGNMTHPLSETQQE